MDGLDTTTIRALLEEVGRRYPQPAQLFLLGGSALCLLGSARPTLDIDYVGDDLHPDPLQQTIAAVAQELGLEVEAVPIDQFIPVPAAAPARHRRWATFGALEVYIFDPYTIALSKLERGFDTDIDDILFLIRQQLIDLDQLTTELHTALQQAVAFGLSRQQTLAHLAVVRQRLAAAP
jgi:hypothetical protein